MVDVKAMLEFKVKAIEQFHKLDQRHMAIERFILKHAPIKNGQPLPKPYRRGRVKQCFGNATRLVERYPELFYVEGFAARHDLPIEFRHAWCEDCDGNVIDPTWRGVCNKDLYMGIPIPEDLHRKLMLKNNCYSVFWIGDLELPNWEFLPELEQLLKDVETGA